MTFPIVDFQLTRVLVQCDDSETPISLHAFVQANDILWEEDAGSTYLLDVIGDFLREGFHDFDIGNGCVSRVQVVDWNGPPLPREG